MERLQKVIANSGECSRRKAEELIINGKVSVNGEIVRELGTKVSSSDLIVVNGRAIEKCEKAYYLLNKPREVISSASDNHGRKTVCDIVKDDKRLYPVGRLDYDTTGLIILTNDGEFANLLMHPKNEIEKVYIAKINGVLSPSNIMALKSGVVYENVKYKRSKIKVRKVDRESNTSVVEVTIHEGHNHEVRNMFKAIGFEVLKLKRERIAFLDLHGLNSGEYRKLNHKEVSELYNLAKNK